MAPLRMPRINLPNPVAYLKLSPNSRMPSKRIVASYVLDWIVIVLLAAVGGGLNYLGPSNRPFSLVDLSISFPYVEESISTTDLGLIALLAPAVIIAAVCLILVPGPSIRRSLTKPQVLRRKLWELHVGFAGLALSIALAFIVTQFLKVLFPKPRPHFLAVCKPDLDNVAAHVVGGDGQSIDIRWTLVNASICTVPANMMLSDGFKSFPSGHSSFSWSGLLYLSLFICSKFSIAIPYLPMQLHNADPAEDTQEASNNTELLPMPATSGSDKSQAPLRPIPQPVVSNIQPVYNQAAAPPNYGLILVLIPLAVATYICSTRYREYWHFAIDVIGGSLIGIVAAWLSFRWYHLPIRQGQGWAWGPRSRKRAFGIGVGQGTWVGPEGWESITGSNAEPVRT